MLNPRLPLLIVTMTVTASSLPVAGSNSPLVNAGFEDADVLAAWRTWIYRDGEPPVIRVDTREVKEGRQSLLVQADAPADVALGQVVALPVGSVWRVRGWVKTENLVARDRTDTGGTIHVQTANGAPIARGSSAFGSTPWREVEVPFRVPSDGHVKIVLFYIGFGKGIGKVWFDDLRLEPLKETGADEIRITPERLSRLPVDAKQGGQFIELLCGLIPSLLAQQVANTSFEIEPPWKVAFKREVDKPPRPWYPDGAVHLARYSFDTNQPFNGKRALRIELPAAFARAGISQDGFCLKKALDYRLRLHARSEGGVAVRATLHGGGGLAAAPVLLGRAGGQWTQLEGKLRASCTTDHATLTLDFEGAGTLWLDRVSLIGEDAVLGLWRPEVVEALRQMHPGMVRFGGSTTEEYEWDKSVGSWDARAPFPINCWGGLEENFVGVEEFVALCREVGAEPLVCLRWTSKQPADAAAEVEYLNGAPDTPQGSRRAQNGHPKPWGVKYWQIGNEVGGKEYDHSVGAFAEAMRRVDPTIRLLSAFPSIETLRAAGGQLDYLCPHHYGCADLEGMERSFVSLEDQIRRFGGERPVRIAVTEWNTTAGDWDLGRAMLLTLANALGCSRYHNLMQRHADSVEIAIRSNLIDSFGSGVIQPGPGWMYLAPTYHAQRLYARAASSYPLRLSHPGPSQLAQPPWYLVEPDLSAVLSPDGRILRLYGVNSTDQPINVKASLAGFDERVVRGDVYVLKDSQPSHTPEVLNTRDEPERVRVFHSSAHARGRGFTLSFEPFSLTLYELELSRGGSR